MDKDHLQAIITQRLARERDVPAARWRAPEGVTTRHVWIDDLLPQEAAREIHAAYPARAEGLFDRDSFREKKRTLTDRSGPPPIRSAISCALQAPAVIDACGQIAGIAGPVADHPCCGVSPYVFSPAAPGDTHCFRVTAFTGRPGQTARRVPGRVDNALRQTAAGWPGTGRGRHRVNRQPAGR